MRIVIREVSEIDAQTLGLTLALHGFHDGKDARAVAQAYKMLEGRAVPLWQVLVLLTSMLDDAERRDAREVARRERALPHDPPTAAQAAGDPRA